MADRLRGGTPRLPCFMLLLAGLAQAPATKADRAVASPTSPTLVTLDFKDQTLDQIVRTLDDRSGGGIEMLGMNNDPNAPAKRYTIESAAPVPLWEALDRLSTTAGVRRTTTSAGLLGTPRPRVQIQRVMPPAEADPGPALYVGPYRLGPATTHETFERTFLAPGPAGRINGPAKPPFFVEIPIAAEPGLIAVWLGPTRVIEAVDDRGRSLVDPASAAIEAKQFARRADLREPSSVIIPMVRPGGTIGAIATLRGSIPLEVARRPAKPTTVVKLAEASGKTFRDGGVAVTVREFKAVGNQTQIKLTVRLEGERGEADGASKALRDARLWAVAHHQLAILDALGRPIGLGGGGGPNPQGDLNFDYTHTAYPAGATEAMPATLLIYRVDWVAWDLAFAFKNLPMP